MKRQRGMTLVEIMIAMLLAGIVSAFILMITRSQLIAYEQTDQVARMQQNERAGVSFVEALLRKACGGISNGVVGINLASTQKIIDCVTVTDGSTTKPDQVDIIFGTKPFTSVTTSSLTASPPTATVADTSGFTAGDYVLLTGFDVAMMFKIKTISTTSGLGVLTMDTPGGALQYPTGWDSGTVGAKATTAMKAQAYSIYIDDGTLNAPSTAKYFKNMLMLNSDTYAATAAPQPIVENVIDFQIAMGLDNDNSGDIAASEWYGDDTGELPLALNLWNGGINPRQFRMSMIFQTNNVYPGVSYLPSKVEDRTTFPSAAGGSPRYRPVSIIVAPRAWNLSN